MRNRPFPNYPDDVDYTTNAPSYYEDLARKEKLIRLLAERIWGYEEILDETLEEIQERFHAWDKNLEDFPDDVKNLLQQWLDDGTLDHIINDTIFNWKLDTAIFEQFRDSTTAQLQQTEQELSSQLAQLQQTEQELSSQLAQKVGDGKLATMSDLGQDVKEAMTGGSVAVVGDNAVIESNIVDKQVTPRKTTFIKSLNLLDEADIYTSTTVNNTTGQLEASTVASRAFDLELTIGNAYYISQTTSQRFKLWLLDENKTPISNFVTLDIGWNSNFSHPTAKYLRGEWVKADYPNPIVCDTANEPLLKDGYNFKADDIYNADTVNALIKSNEVYDLFDIHSNFLKGVSFVDNSFISSLNGGIGSNDVYVYPDTYIPMTFGKRYYAFKNEVQIYFAQHYAVYDKNKIFLRGGTTWTDYIEPQNENEKLFRFSILKTDFPDYSNIEIKESPDGSYQRTQLKDEYIGSEVVQSGIETPTRSIGASASLSDGGLIELDLNAIKKNKTLSFTSRITAFNGLILGHGQAEYGASYIDIDATTIKLYNYESSAKLTATFTHGLTISGFINVFMNVDKDSSIVIRLITDGGMYETTPTAWSGYNGKPFAKSMGSTLTDCKLVWDCTDYKKPIYAFGDSYMNLTAVTRWAYYIRTFGFDNWLCNGFPGQKSASAYTMLTNILAHHKPKILIWAMGMNDADTTVVNASWQSNYDAVKALCITNNIEFIPCTIPSVPARVHTYKNAVVRDSGLRYIDFDKAVGADLSTSWFTGMLSEDLVHPDELGAKALAMQALMDVPELAVEP